MDVCLINDHLPHFSFMSLTYCYTTAGIVWLSQQPKKMLEQTCITYNEVCIIIRQGLENMDTFSSRPRSRPRLLFQNQDQDHFSCPRGASRPRPRSQNYISNISRNCRTVRPVFEAMSGIILQYTNSLIMRKTMIIRESREWQVKVKVSYFCANVGGSLKSQSNRKLNAKFLHFRPKAGRFQKSNFIILPSVYLLCGRPRDRREERPSTTVIYWQSNDEW